jgi:hypothetical protein
MFNYNKAFKKASQKHFKWVWNDAKEESVKTLAPEEFEFALKWYPKLKIFKRTARATVSFNPETMEAFSYDWWCFVKVFKGKVVFNEYRYSNTTSNHQRKVKHLLRQLGIKIDLFVNSPKGLQNGLDGALTHAYEDLFTFQVEEKRRGAKPRTNAIKAQLELIKEIKKLTSFKANIEGIKKLAASKEEHRLTRMRRVREEKKYKALPMVQTFYDNKVVVPFRR